MLVLGIDGGGTKTLAALVDRDGQVRRLAQAADTNPLDQPAWEAHLADAVGGALRGEIPVACAAGLPVFGELPDMSRRQEAALRRLLPAPCSLRNDVHVAHEGAFVGRPGALLLAGTGSMCWAIDAAGAMLRVGGWGDGFGDEGSAWWIGREAFARVSRILDGRLAGDEFATAILQAAGIGSGARQEAMLRWFYDHPNRRPAVAALSTAVDRLAASGDAVASALLVEAADALALHVATVRRRLDVPDWCFVGGVSRSARMRALLTERLGAPCPPALPPIGGAVWRAACDAGWAADAGWIARLNESLAQCLETP